MLVMDSGLGGISVVRALRAQQPGRKLRYLADTAFFPYGGRDAGTLARRAATLIETLAETSQPGTVVLACNTLSTLCLAQLREMLSLPLVGTVPAIKTAAAQSASRRFTLLATPNTAHSVYTNDLVEQFAAGCNVDAVGAPNLAQIAEKILLGEPLADEEIAAELAPVFHDDAKGRTDTVVLGCTHYPLILDRLKKNAPWEVQWIDSGDAIARRALSLVTQEQAPANAIAYVTSEADVARYKDVFTREGFDDVALLRA